KIKLRPGGATLPTAHQTRRSMASPSAMLPHEPAGDRPIRVEGGVEDGDLETDGLAGVHEGAQDHAELGSAEPAGQAVVHGRHGGIVENVGVEGDTKAG